MKYLNLIFLIACQGDSIKQSYRPLAEDLDGDGYDESVDCDEERTDIHPGAAEICDGVDNDCDGLVDDEDTRIEGGIELFIDADNDSFGDPESSEFRCEIVDGWTEQGGDCNDSDNTIHPDATEDCNTTTDDNCDGAISEIGALNCIDWFADSDLDGYAGGPPSCMCLPDAVHYEQLSEDCDDSDAAISPDAPEICNDGIDNNCDESAAPCLWNGEIDIGSTQTKVRGETLERFGQHLTPISDLNQDGQMDIWISGNNGSKLFLSPFGSVISSVDAIATTPVEYQNVRLTTDQNGDAIQDIIVGANNGSAAVFLSPFSGSITAAVMLNSPSPNDETVSVLVDDMSGTGTPYYALMSKNEDAVYLHPNSGQNTIEFGSDPNGFELWGTDLSEGNLYAFNDRNGDGIEDLIISTPATSTGAVRIVEGGPLSSGPIQQIYGWNGEQSGDEAGFAVADAGDWDGDGIPDLWVTAPNAGSNNQGRIYLASGGNPGDLTQSSIIIEGRNSNGGFGHTVSVGDNDNDGQADVIACAPFRLSIGGCTLFRSLGSGIVDESTGDLMLSGSSQAMELGYTSAFTNDTYGDIWVSSIFATETANQQGLVFRLAGQGL